MFSVPSKTKSCVFKFLRFEERFRKAPFSWREIVDGRPNRGNKAAFSDFTGIVWKNPFYLQVETSWNLLELNSSRNFRLVPKMGVPIWGFLRLRMNSFVVCFFLVSSTPAVAFGHDWFWKKLYHYSLFSSQKTVYTNCKKGLQTNGSPSLNWFYTAGRGRADRYYLSHISVTEWPTVWELWL